MNESPKTSRLPFYLLLVGVFLISSFGVYLYQNSGSSEDSSASTANKEAEAAIAAAGMSDADRKATEAVVRAYILEHPEIITEAITVLQNREMVSRLSSVRDAVLTPFAGDVAGNPNGDVTVVEFTDYNCGFCRKTVADVDRLIKSDGNIRLIYREVPLLAESSKTAGLWALAAAKQGKHDAFHRAMFAAGKPNDDTIRFAARNAGMDIAAAEKFAASQEALAELQNNVQLMQTIGFNGTPTFIIGDQVIEAPKVMTG
ncbi:MAG: DsbA family protein [Sphingomonadales bacterium]|nr:DsbA family protein [Sphingomonadales bacterium]